MSLINDALKKAQKMRHEETLAAGKTAAGETRPDGGRSRVSPGMIALISGGTALAVCAVVLAGIVLMRSTRSAAPSPAPEPLQLAVQETKTQAAEPAAATRPVSTPLVQTPPAPSTIPSQDAGPLIALPSSMGAKPVAQEPAPAPAPQPQQPAAAAQEKPSSAQQAPVFVFTQPEPDHSKPNPASQRFVDRLRVTGVRKTSSGAKVMLNEKVYRINDVVDQTLGLRLIEAESDRLVFTDEYGHRYVRNFMP
jgi:hypothetical protein